MRTRDHGRTVPRPSGYIALGGRVGVPDGRSTIELRPKYTAGAENSQNDSASSRETRADQQQNTTPDVVCTPTTNAKSPSLARSASRWRSRHPPPLCPAATITPSLDATTAASPSSSSSVGRCPWLFVGRRTGPRRRTGARRRTGLVVVAVVVVIVVVDLGDFRVVVLGDGCAPSLFERRRRSAEPRSNLSLRQNERP